jgi:hypothetical protein
LYEVVTQWIENRVPGGIVYGRQSRYFVSDVKSQQPRKIEKKSDEYTIRRFSNRIPARLNTGPNGLSFRRLNHSRKLFIGILSTLVIDIGPPAMFNTPVCLIWSNHVKFNQHSCTFQKTYIITNNFLSLRNNIASRTLQANSLKRHSWPDPVVPDKTVHFP